MLPHALRNLVFLGCARLVGPGLTLKGALKKYLPPRLLRHRFLLLKMFFPSLSLPQFVIRRVNPRGGCWQAARDVVKVAMLHSPLFPLE